MLAFTIRTPHKLVWHLWLSDTGNQLLGVVVAAATFGLLLSACVPITPVPAPETSGAQETAVPAEGEATTLEGVTWQLTEYLGPDGAPTAPVAEATLLLQDGQASGTSGCNSFSASYTLDGDQLTIGQAAGTMMACEEAIMMQEQAFLANLALAASYAIEGNQLHIFDADGATMLTFEPQVATPLTGTLWQATGYYNGKQAVVTVLAGTEITANFGEDGTLAGRAGCNNYTGTYSVDGDQLSIGPMALTRKMCMEPAGVMEQELAYANALATAATYTIQGDTLELRSANGALVASYVTAAQGEATPAATEEESQLSGVLTGTVTYLQRIALPAGSEIDVQLQDVSKADVAAEIIASQIITTVGENVPIPFTLTYDPSQIDPRYTYALRARITVDGQLRWINTEQYAVLTRDAPVTGIEVIVMPVQ